MYTVRRTFQQTTTRPATPTVGCSSTLNFASAAANDRGRARWAGCVGWVSWVWWVGVSGVGWDGVGRGEMWGARYLATSHPQPLTYGHGS